MDKEPFSKHPFWSCIKKRERWCWKIWLHLWVFWSYRKKSVFIWICRWYKNWV